MDQDEARRQAQREYNRKWYRKNRERVLRERRRKYRESEEYRERMKERNRTYYWTRRRQIKSGEIIEDTRFAEKVELHAKEILEIPINNPEDARYGQKIKVPVYTVKELSRLLNRHPATIRSWERRGVIPKAMFRSNTKRRDRLYTEDQMRVFFASRLLLKLTCRNMLDSAFSRQVWHDWKAMPDGVIPVRAPERPKQYSVTGRCEICGLSQSRIVTDPHTPIVCSKCSGRVVVDQVDEI